MHGTATRDALIPVLIVNGHIIINNIYNTIIRMKKYILFLLVLLLVISFPDYTDGYLIFLGV